MSLSRAKLVISVTTFLISCWGFSNCLAHDANHCDSSDIRPAFVTGLEIGTAFPVDHPAGFDNRFFSLGLSADHLFGQKRRWGVWGQLNITFQESDRWDDRVNTPGFLVYGRSWIRTFTSSRLIGPEFAMTPFGEKWKMVVLRAGIGSTRIHMDNYFRHKGSDYTVYMTLREEEQDKFTYQFSASIEIGRWLSSHWSLSAQYMAVPNVSFMTADGSITGNLKTIKLMLVGNSRPFWQGQGCRCP